MICISNPPYNIKWDIPPFAQMDGRFSECGVPPKSNANYAFVLSVFERADKAVFILPNTVLNNHDKSETQIRERLIEKNYIEAVITCPGKMFVNTDIAVYIIVLNRHKATTDVSFVDMSETYTEEIREQRGQYVGAAHTNRVYKKTFNAFSEYGVLLQPSKD